MYGNGKEQSEDYGSAKEYRENVDYNCRSIWSVLAAHQLW